MKPLVYAMPIALFVSASVHAQDLHVTSSTANTIFQSENTSSVTQDRVAVKGVSSPAPGWGVGGLFEAGWMGVAGYSTVSGSGYRYGVSAYAHGGTNNYGLYAYAPTTSGSYAGYFEGNMYVSGTITQASDLKLKTNIQDLPNGALAQIIRLRPKTYRYQKARFPKLGLPEGEHVGLIAQDVASVFPQAVKEVVAPGDPLDKAKSPESLLSVDYIKMVPLLIKAIQEQQSQIEALKTEIAKLK
jgi:hypothetical protein